MTTTMLDILPLMDQVPAGSWAAISTKQLKLLAIGPDAAHVAEEARRLGEPVPFVMRKPEQESILFL